MSDREASGEHRDGTVISPEQAAALLGRAHVAAARVAARSDFRGQAAIELWSAAGLFCYMAAFLLLFLNAWKDGTSGSHFYYYLLWIPVGIGSQLERGARDRLSVAFRQSRRVLLLSSIPSAIVVFAAAASTFWGVRYTVWQCLLIAMLAAVAPAAAAVRSAVKARAESGRSAAGSRAVDRREPLSPTAQTMTVALGIYLGLFAAVTPFAWGVGVVIFLVFVLLGMAVGKNAQWGLASIGSEWHRRHWVAFGIAAAALLVLAIVATKTTWNTPVFGGITAIVIAAPLALTALIQRR